MKLARVAVLGVAVGAGLIAAFLAMRLSAPAPAPVVVQQAAPSAPAAPPPPPMTEVLVASVDIPIGTTLNADSVEWKEWPATGISDRFIQKPDGTGAAAPAETTAADAPPANPDGTAPTTIDPENPVASVIGSFARASFYAGEPIVAAKLIRSDQGFMAAILPAGMRAVATPIAAVTSAGGFILPNDRVDVIMTRGADSTTAGGGVPYITETILNNVRVLAIDQTIEDQDGQKVVVGQTATLELSPRQVQILNVAQQISDRLTLALRSIADSRSDPADAELDAVHLIGGSKRNGAVTVVKNGVPRDVSGIR